MKIGSLEAYQIIDSRGYPAVEVELKAGNIVQKAASLSGKSRGHFEAVDLRDESKEFFGFGVQKAIDNVNKKIFPAIKDINVLDQKRIDETMIKLDGTKNKAHLGANAILPVSLAVAMICAKHKKISLYRHLAELFGEDNPVVLPIPLMNYIEGGLHAKNKIAIQEFMIVPFGFATYSRAIQAAAEIYHELGKLIPSFGFGDEGGYSPSTLKSKGAKKQVQELIETLLAAIKKAGYKPANEVTIALDCAANTFYKDKLYYLDENESMSSEELINFYESLVENYPIFSIEDGLAENDKRGWELLTKRLGKKIQIVGDDLFVTNPEIFAKGIRDGLANAILIKVNQVGTLTETFRVIKMAKKANYGVIISHRLGETAQSFVSDLAVATNAGQIKAGSISRIDRVEKYNQLLRIERELGKNAKFKK